MANIQSLINGFEAATDSTTASVTSAAVGTDTAMQFVYADDLTVPAGGFSSIYAFGDSL